MKPSALLPDSVAVITGGASGIGLAAAKTFARNRIFGLYRRSGQRIGWPKASPKRSRRQGDDVGNRCQRVPRRLKTLEASVTARFGGVDILMNNAGIAFGSTAAWGRRRYWAKVLDVNLMGIVNGAQIFAPGMIARGRPGLIINTGSKQGITTPPGDRRL